MLLVYAAAEHSRVALALQVSFLSPAVGGHLARAAEHSRVALALQVSYNIQPEGRFHVNFFVEP